MSGSTAPTLPPSNDALPGAYERLLAEVRQASRRIGSAAVAALILTENLDSAAQAALAVELFKDVQDQR